MFAPDRRAVLLLSLPGVAMGALSLAGLYPDWVEALLWTAIAAGVWTPLLVVRRTRAPVLTGALGAALAGLWTGSIQSAFAWLYIRNHPASAADLHALTPVMFVATFVGVGLVLGALFGAASGAAAWALLRRREKTAGAPARPTDAP